MPPRFAPILFGLLLSGSMSFIVSGVATFRAIGWTPAFITLWLTSWVFSWAVAFPSVLVMRPVVQWIVARATRKGTRA